MFESYSPRREAVLVRNPEFREWSADAQPEGNADRIHVTFGLTEDAETTQVAQGHANWMMGQVPSGRLADVAERTPDQLHVNPTNEVWFATLNTKVAPFDDVNVRRAVNLAVDRNAVVKLAGGPRLAAPTCQVLPPEFPGYEAYCPYTQDPGDRWTAPDMEEARRLVDASGTRGQRVTLITYADEPYRSIGLYLVSVLRDLGYDARARALVGDVYVPYINNTGNRVQIAGPINWFPDYPAPSNFLNQVLGCNGYRPDSDANVNASQFCEPEIQRQTEEALRLGQTDPEAAAPLWARIDQETTDLAPWISLYVAEAMDYVSADVRNFVYNPSAIGGFMYELATVE
jgi:peptide/nickel transport system substrate-binding protein